MRTPPPVLPDEADQPRYKTTWLDRHGTEGGLKLRAIGYGLVVFGSTVGAALLLLAQGGARVGWFPILMLFVIAAVFAILVTWSGLAISRGSGAVAKAFTLPSGNSTPYEEQFSYQETMIARGNLHGALESYEAIISERPTAVAPRDGAVAWRPRGITSAARTSPASRCSAAERFWL